MITKVEIKQSESTRFRMACKFTNVKLQDFIEQPDGTLSITVKLEDSGSLFRTARLMDRITEEQLQRFLDAEAAVKIMDDLRTEL